jgi:hypothetical protein
LKDQFKQLKKIGIFERDLQEAWEKCAVRGIEFLSPFMWCPRRGWAEITGMDRAPEGWKERYGSDVGYWIDFKKQEPSEIRRIVKELAIEYPNGWGIKIKPSEFYRVLFFHEVAHTLPICGLFLNELCAMSKEERLELEHQAWLWGLEMARQKNPEIKVLCYSRKKEDKLEHSNFCQWYGLLKWDDEWRRREKLKKGAIDLPTKAIQKAA